MHIRCRRNCIEITTSNPAFAQHFIDLIHEKIHKRPTRLTIKVEAKHLPIISELMKQGFLLSLGFDKNCHIRFTVDDNALEFVLYIYHSPNKELARDAEEAAWVIR